MKQPKRLSRFLERVSDRLGRSSRVFLVGLVVACGIEVAVDWNSTLFEINVLRAALKQKGENYADLLRKAAEPAILAYDADELERLSAGVFEDEDVVYVRYTDVLGNTLYDRLLVDYSRAFYRAHGETFRVHYRHPMARDAAGMAEDPIGLRQRMERSRHRDFIQAFTDGENALMARFSSAPPPAHEAPPRVLYQDRLADARGERDRETSYAVGAITAEDGDVYGVVLVAFRHDRLNRAVAGKLWKGLAITVFFVALILVQNFVSRKAKLRLLDLEAALAAARAAIRSALPSVPAPAWARVRVAFAQAERVGGTIYDLREEGGALELLVAVPEGAGVDAAFASVVLRDLYRRTEPGEPAARARALLAAYEASPLGRPVELLLLRVAPDGVRGVAAGLAPPAIAGKPIELGDPVAFDSKRLVAPLRQFAAPLSGTLAIFEDGLPPGAPRRHSPPEALAQLARGVEPERVVAQAVKRWRGKHTDDFFALTVERV
jgi:hypothetical protein